MSKHVYTIEFEDNNPYALVKLDGEILIFNSLELTVDDEGEFEQRIIKSPGNNFHGSKEFFMKREQCNGSSDSLNINKFLHGLY